MCKYASVENKGFARRSLILGLLSALALTGVYHISRPCFAQEPESGFGAIVSDKASAEDVGLPLYPGSKPHKDKSNDSQAARLGLWGDSAGFKLALVKMDSGSVLQESPVEIRQGARLPQPLPSRIGYRAERLLEDSHLRR